MYKAQTTTTGAQLFDKNTLLNGVVLTAGSDAATLQIYEGTSTSDPLVTTLAAATGTSKSVRFDRPGLPLSKMYIVVTGTSATGCIYYS